MSDTVMLNVRLDKTLKEHGAQVLKASGISATEYVRRAFRYLEDNQRVPDCFAAGAEDKYAQRRKAIRVVSQELASDISAAAESERFDPQKEKSARREEKFARYFA